MQLEQIETLCLNYLRQAENPLVPIDLLLEHCQRQEEGEAIDKNTLLSFLREHELVMVMDGPSSDAEVSPNIFAQAGLLMGERAILTSRIPSPAEMAEIMQQQILVMREALQKALSLAEENQEAGQLQDLQQAIARTDELGARIKDLS